MTLLAFGIGFASFALIVLLYLLYQFIQIFREFVLILKEEWKDV